MWGIELLVMLVMIAVNSVFAGYEIALASVGAARLQRLVGEGRRGAKVALRMKQNMEASLAVVQLGITLAGVIAATVGGAGAEEIVAPRLEARLGVSEDAAEALAIALVALPLTVVTIVVGELIPKVFALRNAERVTLALSPLMRWFSFSVWPAVRLFEWIVSGVMAWGERVSPAAGARETAALHDLRAGAALARASRLIGHREEGIILGAMALRTRAVREIMLAADQIRTLAADASLADALIAAHLDMHTRFPVVERPDDVQSAVGYVNVKDIIAVMHLNPAEPSLRAIVRPLLSFDAERSIADCLEQLMHQHTHIALVRDAGGRVLGMVSMEDVIEELVGDIEDEYDRLPAHLVGSGPAWVAGGGVSLERLKAVTGVDLETAAVAGGTRTLSGWVAAELGRAVRGGDVVERGSVRIVIRKVRRGNVQEAQIQVRA